MKKYLFLLTFLFITFAGWAQDDEYQTLIKQREGLIVEYNYLNAQNSNFWGKKSKKDLMKIIDNLKAIIKKAGLVKNDDLVINIASMPMKEKGRTNMMKLSYIN